MVRRLRAVAGAMVGLFDVDVVASRGLAGIDGCVATASGVALAEPRPTYAVVGDLTFLHDSGALVLGPAEPRPDLTVVVLDDRGGSIFATLEYGEPGREEPFDRVFATPTTTDLVALARAQRAHAARLLIENTAGGDNAMTRYLDRIAGVWDAISGCEQADMVGFCLDTCHAWAGGEELMGIVERVLAITGRIDLVHLNNSRDEFDSARDRHANLQDGTIDPDLLADVARAAGAPIILETPSEGLADDVAYLKEALL